MLANRLAPPRWRVREPEGSQWATPADGARLVLPEGLDGNKPNLGVAVEAEGIYKHGLGILAED
jgi:hypothetical protein